MDNGAEEKQSSYTYWVRQATEDAAPLPVPRKLSANDMSMQSQPNALGSVWNRAGTWEEKNLNTWASNRIKCLNRQKQSIVSYCSCQHNLRTENYGTHSVGPELLTSVGSLEFSSGNGEISEVTKCVGDAFLVTVRNKKRFGYTYELTLKFKGEWLIREEKKVIKGHIDIPEFSFGELDDLQMEVRLGEGTDLVHQDKTLIAEDLRQFLRPIREKLFQFEQELKDR